jgi:hypothetical protein
VFDSSSKPPSSILSGNLANFGDFDACLNLKPPDEKLKGKFCLSSVMFEIEDENFVDVEKINELKEKILGGNTFISEFKDVSEIFLKNI